MSKIDEQIRSLTLERKSRGETVLAKQLPSGARLIEIRDYKLPAGWDQRSGVILFIAPPAFPAAQPDCFWIEPAALRYGGGRTPQNSNDQNPIPEDGRQATWFSWHLSSWNPNSDTLSSYLKVIEQRLSPPR